MATIGIILLLAGYGAYKYYNSSKGDTASWLMSRLNNIDDFRDITFNSIADILKHPDVLNNGFAFNPESKTDLGVYGINRNNKQLYSGTSEITQTYRSDNLVL